ncbi:MAG: amino acid ABC transporter permease [Firmicutes bacterium]|nr:amino acid ABC transporter permease [Bacillota bacterium]
MPEFILNLVDQFKFVFLEDDRWMYLAEGLVTTLQITFFALILGITIGVTIAIIRSTHDNTIETLRPGIGKISLKILNAIAKVYLTVIRGTPIVVQLLIMYCIVFAASNNKVFIAIIAFGINSGAYVAEIVRSGIMSIDKGQMEAGRSLGYNYVQAMIFIIIPQAIKNILPALANEFITLLKETSVSGYIAIQDLTKGAYIIIGRTYTAFMPLITVALVYLTLVLFFTWLVGKMERRLRNSDH